MNMTAMPATKQVYQFEKHIIMPGDNKAIGNPSAQACLACRSRHLRCDGTKPVCGRCQQGQIECKYVQSRRGYVGGRRKAQSRNDSVSDGSTGNNRDLLDPSSSTDISRSTSHAASVASNSPYRHLSSPTSTVVQSESLNDELIDTFYAYIHHAHPMVIPKKLYLQDPDALPTHLKAVMRFIAVHHTRESPDPYKDAAYAILGKDVPNDAFRVQGLLLLTVCSFSRCEREIGGKALHLACMVAHAVGLDTEQFDMHNSPVWRESWRRTWWELYSISLLVSLVSCTDMRISAPPDRCLPGHYLDYERCMPSTIRPLADMEDRILDDDDFKWSAFAFRVEASRILGMVLDLRDLPELMHGPRIDIINASIKTFLLTLPDRSSRAYLIDGETDEMLEAAIMTISLAAIGLHLPRSELANFRLFSTFCGTEQTAVASDNRAIHTAAAVRSADAVSELIMARSSLKTISPCYSCALAFVVTTQLSMYCLKDGELSAKYLKEYIQLSLASLKVMGQSWQISQVVRMQLASFARDILQRPNKTVHIGFGLPEITLAETMPPLTSDGAQWMTSLVNEVEFSFAELPPGPNETSVLAEESTGTIVTS